LLHLKLEQLLEVSWDLKIVLSTDDEEVINVGESFKSSRIIIDRRPEHLCLSTTKVQDLIMYVPQIISTDHVFWLHTTTPFVGKNIYEEALRKYFLKIEEGYDSIMSVSKLQSFLWDDEKKKIINFDRDEIKYPQTQDLDPLYEINHAFYAMSIKNYLKYEDRIGVLPYLFELNKGQSIDIDWQEDFELAEMVYQHKKDEV
jgi:CMP-N-acetylneuraminic acid synthetase